MAELLTAAAALNPGVALPCWGPASRWPFLIANGFAVTVSSSFNSPSSPFASSCSRLNPSLTWVHQTGCVLSTMRLEIWLFWVLPWGGQPHVSGEFLDLTIVFKSPEMINAYHHSPEICGNCRASSLQCSGGPLWGSQVNGRINPNPPACGPYNQTDSLPKAPRSLMGVCSTAGRQAGSAVWGHPCSFLSRSTQMILLELRKIFSPMWPWCIETLHVSFSERGHTQEVKIKAWIPS